VGTVVIGGPLFEIALVLLFVFMALSGLVSAFQELIVQIFRLRSRNLRRGIDQLLSDSHYKDEIAKRFFRHPMLTSLGKSGTRVTSIESSAFLQALASAIQPAWSKEDAVIALPSSVAALDEGELKHRLSLVVPPPSDTPDRELIEKSVDTWFQTSINKISQRYKSDAMALSYIIAAGLTVLFNVSPIEISQRLTTDNSLRTAFASTVPELATMVFNTGQGIPVSLPIDDGPSGTAAGGSGLSSADIQTMLAVFQCSRNEINFFVGWPWMGDALDAFAGSEVAAFVLLPSEKDACAAAIERAGESPALRAKLTAVGKPPTDIKAASASEAVVRQYGPSFATDNPALILLGWLISTMAAAQGAPFWFDAVRKVALRR
jgi:hypothetical protein